MKLLLWMSLVTIAILQYMVVSVPLFQDRVDTVCSFEHIERLPEIYGPVKEKRVSVLASDAAAAPPVSTLMCQLLPRQPAQIWLAGSQRLVQPAHRCSVRRRLDDLGICARLLCNLLHDTDEVVQRFARLRLRWLNHHGLVYDQWKVDGWRVHAKVEQAFGDIQRCNSALFFLTFSRSDELVLADLRIGDIIILRQFVFEVVRVEDGTLRYLSL